MPTLSTFQYVSIIDCSKFSNFKAEASHDSNKCETKLRQLQDMEQLQTPMKYLGYTENIKMIY